MKTLISYFMYRIENEKKVQVDFHNCEIKALNFPLFEDTFHIYYRPKKTPNGHANRTSWKPLVVETSSQLDIMRSCVTKKQIIPACNFV